MRRAPPVFNVNSARRCLVSRGAIYTTPSHPPAAPPPPADCQVDPDSLCSGGTMHDSESGLDLEPKPCDDDDDVGTRLEPEPPEVTRSAHATMRFRAPVLCEVHPMPLSAHDPLAFGMRQTLSGATATDEAPPNDWPIYTKSHCWWDTYPIDGMPVGVPLLYNERSDVYECYGYFCSPSCALAYFCREMRTGTKRSVVQGWIDRIARTVLRQRTPVIPARARCELKRFNGTRTIEEFRALSQYSTSTELPVPQRVPFRVMHPEVMETYVLQRAPEKVVETAVERPDGDAVDFAPTTAAPTPTGAKRPRVHVKPPGRAPSRLETSLGIRRVRTAVNYAPPPSS